VAAIEWRVEGGVGKELLRDKFRNRSLENVHLSLSTTLYCNEHVRARLPARLQAQPFFL
jgi:hypothetical protein